MPFFHLLCPDLADANGNRISQLFLSETSLVNFIISALVPRKLRSISKSSLLNLADTCVGKSLNKNKFVDVPRQETQRTDKIFHEPTLPSASAFTVFSANSPCSTLQMKPTHQPVMIRPNAFTQGPKEHQDNHEDNP